jgi:hypothetical protein
MSLLGIVQAITTLAQVGTTIYSGIKGNEEIEKTNVKNEALYESIQKQNLKQQEFQNKLNLRTLSFNEEQAELNRKEVEEQKGYNRMQNAANKYAEYVNRNSALTGARLSPIINRGMR